MEPWTFDQIRRVTLGRRLTRGKIGFTGRICTDSRQAMPGDLFFTIKGARFDAREFLSDVIGRGAAGIVLDGEVSADLLAKAERVGVTVLATDSTVKALNRLAAAVRREWRTRVIAVGGSNGKTTTKGIIYEVLSTKFTGYASPKSFNNNIGLPLTLLAVEPQHEFVVVEIGTNSPGEVESLGLVAQPDIAVITSVGMEHLEFFGDLAGVAREEASLVRHVAHGAVLFMPNDSPELVEALRMSRISRFTVGYGGTGAELEATEIVEKPEGVEFSLNGRRRFTVPLLGRHNVINSLLAIGVARRMGLDDELISQGLLRLKPAPMRLQSQRMGEHIVINDAYNANPTSVTSALEVLARFPAGRRRRVAILGDMLELGAASETCHREIGRCVAQHQIDLLVAVGPQMRLAAEEAQRQGVASKQADSPGQAGALLKGLLKGDELILLKGSRGMRMEDALKALEPAEPVATMRQAR